VKSVDLYKITLDGCTLSQKGGSVINAKLVLSLKKDEAVSIVPAGARFTDNK